MIPTQEQIKEFLQWCGIQCYYKDESNDDIEAWICPPNGEKTVAFYGLTLDFLFKYAVPIALEEIAKRGFIPPIMKLFQLWYDELVTIAGDSNKTQYAALALFWVLDKIREEK